MVVEKQQIYPNVEQQVVDVDEISPPLFLADDADVGDRVGVPLRSGSHPLPYPRTEKQHVSVERCQPATVKQKRHELDYKNSFENKLNLGTKLV